MLWNWPWLRTRNVESPWKISPSGVFWFSWRSACDDLAHREIERGDLLLRQIDVDLPPDAAVDGDRGDAVHALEAGRDLVLSDLAQRDRVVLALDADLHDRQLVRVELEDRGRVGILGQPVAHAVHARPHFVGRFRQVRAPFEIQPDLTVAFGRARFDTRDAGHGADRLLHGPRDQFLHLERTHAGIAGADVELSAARTPASDRPEAG